VTAEFVGSPVDSALGTDWARGSLAQGSMISMLMTERLAQLARARLLVPPQTETASTSIDDFGRGIMRSDSDRVVRLVLGSLATVGLRTLVVEDDLARRGDHVTGGKLAFVDDRIIRWVDLEAGASDGVALLRTGASGYPLNAFGSVLSAAALGLSEGKSMDSDQQQLFVEGVGAVFVSVFDAEACLMLLTAELDDRLVALFEEDSPTT
jgi:hypothetical protein